MQKHNTQVTINFALRPNETTGKLIEELTEVVNNSWCVMGRIDGHHVQNIERPTISVSTIPIPVPESVPNKKRKAEEISKDVENMVTKRADFIEETIIKQRNELGARRRFYSFDAVLYSEKLRTELESRGWNVKEPLTSDSSDHIPYTEYVGCFYVYLK